ncbi:M24 family metallopeptidase [Aquamicrobium terrae]|uniref:Xaa-Pro dipeptidase n=1 Tax=Aquamicrobium terrae TaxID=1324945 RepID=A0ABV2N4A1_9HYPH
MLQARLDGLRAMMTDQGLDAVALVPGNAFRYFLGPDMPFLERPTVVVIDRQGGSKAVIPAIERATWQKVKLDGDTSYWRDEDGYAGIFAAQRGQVNARRIGVESFRMRVAELNALQSMVPDAEIVPIHTQLWELRSCKDASEIDMIRRAVCASEEAIRSTLEEVRVGMSEMDVKAILQGHITSCSGIGITGELLVLAGDNSARPHGRSRMDYRIRKGDALLIDFAATCEGYCSDVTRTAFVGAMSDEQHRLYDTVLRANEIGRGLVRPGVSAHEVDDVVQSFLEASPFRDFIVHKTGHGLGLDVHELPHLMRGNHTPLAQGNVVTVEPGLYKPGEIGVRIEDVLAVTENDREELSTFTREPLVVG